MRDLSDGEAAPLARRLVVSKRVRPYSVTQRTHADCREQTPCSAEPAAQSIEITTFREIPKPRLFGPEKTKNEDHPISMRTRKDLVNFSLVNQI